MSAAHNTASGDSAAPADTLAVAPRAAPSPPGALPIPLHPPPNLVLDTFAERLKFIVSLFGSPETFATPSGISSRSLRNYLQGSASPGLDNLERIAAFAHIRIGWLVEGELPIARGEFKPQASPTASEPTPAPAGLVTIPWFESWMLEPQPPAQPSTPALALSRDWLAHRGVAAQPLAAWHVTDNSMAPALQVGDTVVLDLTHCDRPPYGAKQLYLVQDTQNPQALFLRVVARLFDGSLLLYSGPHFPSSEALRGQEVERLRFLGRVIWFSRTLQDSTDLY